MSALLEHKWGENAAADRIWAHVAGMAPARAASRLIMAVSIYRAFVDESYSQGGEYVLAGVVSTAEAWSKFAVAWTELLPTATKSPKGTYRFKMREMAKADRMPRVEAFYRVAEEFAPLVICSRLHKRDFDSALNRIVRDFGKQGVMLRLGIWQSPYYVLAMELIQTVAENREQFSDVIPIDSPIDFIFDENSEKRAILDAWEEFTATAPDIVRNRLGMTPTFGDDEVYLPIQAADMWAWWVRKWFEDHKSRPGPPAGLQSLDFGLWKPTKPTKIHGVQMREKHVYEKLMYVILRAVDDGNVRPF